MSQHYRLDTKSQTLVLAERDGRMAQIVYLGAALPQAQSLADVAQAYEIDVTGGMLDAAPELSICPEASQTFPGQNGMIIRSNAGTLMTPRFRAHDAQVTDAAIVLAYKDDTNGLTYTAQFKAVGDVFELSARLVSDDPIHLQWLSAPVVPAPQNARDMIEFSGRWIGEFQTDTTPWLAGARLRNNRTGRTGHEHFPALIVPSVGTTNTSGDALAFHYDWSGGHQMIAEELPDGRRQVQFGNAPDTERHAGHTFETATLYVTHSQNGLNGCATAFQRHVRDAIVQFPDANRPRPVHYNCWEAIYFDHDIDQLKDIATRAAELGAERFVLDDGWFGKRDDDTTSLGDWTIDPRKYPDGLQPLIDHIHAQDMRFGIWFEPEMVNPESDLYRAHPDWVLGALDQPLGRQQMVLDISKPEVREYLYTHIADILTNYDVDYIKWDHNRVLPVADADQARGFYALVDRLRHDFPTVEIESCSSGGGRIDFGVLSRTHRVWLSDSNDAIERLKIQHNAALFLPLVVTGSHIGPRECHTSGRIIPIEFRAWVAAQRHMGFEMDPRELTDHETTVLTRVTQWWKDNRDWTSQADILRLNSDDPAVISEMQLAKDGAQFVVFAGRWAASDQISPRPIRLDGLDPDALYKLSLVNSDEADKASRIDTGLLTGHLTLSGAYLMSHGLTLPSRFPNSMWVIKGEKQ